MMNKTVQHIGTSATLSEAKPASNKIAKSVGKPERVTIDSIGEISRGMGFSNAMFLRALAKLEYGKLLLRLPDNRNLEFSGVNPGPDAELLLNNWKLPTKIFASASIGAGESYMNGDWDSPDMTALFEFFSKNENLGGGLSTPIWIKGAIIRILHWLNSNTRRGARKNIAAHYDLGNEFYSKWLDESMTYSSGIFGEDVGTLSGSQEKKYRMLAQSMGIKPMDKVLEIGCGWGGFAEYVATQIGCQITGLTISKEQHDFAQKRVHEAGLSEKIDIKLQDYRDETGNYDRIASIEMFEAVGEKYWPTYFTTLRDCLRPEGTAGLQIITIGNNAFEKYSRRPDFIQRYIFPGGMLPSPEILDRLRSSSGMTMLGERVFPQDYAKTLAEWRRRFLAKWGEIQQLGFDERFKRMWEFYLHYCEAGFKTEYIDVRQIIYRK
jgi:cyclopropane-fatty-acyl-phospholipid synthase